MSTEVAKKERSLEEIKQEYLNVASGAGTLQYQIVIFGEQLKQINNKMIELNNEAAEAQKREHVEIKQ